jgi:hypothetical protein
LLGGEVEAEEEGVGGGGAVGGNVDRRHGGVEAISDEERRIAVSNFRVDGREERTTGCGSLVLSVALCPASTCAVKYWQRVGGMPSPDIEPIATAGRRDRARFPHHGGRSPPDQSSPSLHHCIHLASSTPWR